VGCSVLYSYVVEKKLLGMVLSPSELFDCSMLNGQSRHCSAVGKQLRRKPNRRRQINCCVCPMCGHKHCLSCSLFTHHHSVSFRISQQVRVQFAGAAKPDHSLHVTVTNAHTRMRGREKQPQFFSFHDGIEGLRNTKIKKR